MSSNKPMIGPVVLDIVSIFFEEIFPTFDFCIAIVRSIQMKGQSVLGTDNNQYKQHPIWLTFLVW